MDRRANGGPSSARVRLIASSAVVVALLGLSALSEVARADRSIFDDDYWDNEAPPRKSDAPAPTQPPSPSAESRPLTPPPPEIKSATPAPVSPQPSPEPTRPSEPAPPSPVAVQKYRVPTLEQQAAADKAVRDAFAAQLADKTRTGRRYVADLLVYKSTSEPDVARRYAMLALARDLAADAGDVRRAVHAVDALEKAYHVNGPKMRVDVFVRAKPRLADAFDHSAAVTEGLQLMEDLTARAQYRQLPVIAPVVRFSAQKSEDKSLAASVRQATADAEAVATEFDKAKAAADLLKQSPDDPEANLAVGRFLCLVRDDWKSGLPKLLQGPADDPLVTLAVHETAGKIKSPPRRRELAEAWWTYGEANKAAPLFRKRAQFRACAWYGTILSSLTGLEKVVAEKRLAEARANGVDVGTRPSDFPADAN